MKIAASLLALVGASACAAPPARSRALARSAIESAHSRRGDLRLSCEPTDAEVWLDGVPQGTCVDFSGDPRGLAVGEGMHEVVVQKAGFWPYQTFYAPSGARAALSIRLSPHSTAQGAAR